MNLVQRLTAFGLVASTFLAACGDDTGSAASDVAKAGASGSGPGGNSSSGGRAGAGAGGSGLGGQAGRAGASGGSGTGGTAGGAGADATVSGGSSGAAGQVSGATGGNGTAGQAASAGTGGATGSVGGGAGSPTGSGGTGASSAGGANIGGANAGGTNAGGTNAGGTGAGAAGANGGRAGAGATGGTQSGGGFGGTASGGAGPIPKGLSACGPATSLSVGSVAAGKLSAASTAVDLSCGWKAPGASTLYEIIPEKSGALDIQFNPAAATPNELSALVTIEAGCASPAGQTLLCPNYVYEKSLLTVPVTAGVPVTMAVTTGEKGDPNTNYSFFVGFHEIICGDGKIDASEQCDPPNGTDCSASCARQTPPCGDKITTYPELCDPPGVSGCGLTCAYDQCPDLRVLKDGGSVSGSFVGQPVVLLAACGASPSARQLTYEITAENTGVLEIDLVSQGNTLLSVVDSCTSKANQLACETMKGESRFAKAVNKGDKVVVVLTRDNKDLDQSITVKAKTRAIVCGDSVIDPGEGCDPPDAITCSSSCQRQAPPCGDKIVTAPEQCDPPSGTLCSASCTYLGCPNVVTLADGGTTTVALAGKPTFSESCGGFEHQVAIAVVPTNTGSLEVTVDGDIGGYVMIAAETVCGEATSPFECRDAKLAGGASTVSFKSVKGQTRYLVFSSEKLNPSAPPFQVSVKSTL